MVKSFMAGGLHKDSWGPTLGLFKLRLSELWHLAHLTQKLLHCYLRVLFTEWLEWLLTHLDLWMMPKIG